MRGWLALTFGALGVAFGVPSAYWLSQGEASGDHYTTGPPAILAGIVLMVTGLVVLWRSRRSYGSRRRTYLRRAPDARRFGGTGIRDLLAGRLPGRLRLHLHAHRARRRRARPPRPVRAGHRHDQRLGRADGLVRPLQEPRRGDPLPRRDPLRRSPDADPARLRRPAPEPARSGHERRRHRPLGGRPRPARRRRVRQDAPRRGRRPDRRVRLLGRRRDPDRGGGAVDGLQGDRVGRRRLPHRRGRPEGRRPPAQAVAGRSWGSRPPSSPTRPHRRRSPTGSARSPRAPCS